MINIKDLWVGNWVEVYNISALNPTSYAQIAGIDPDGSFYINDPGSSYYWKLKEDKEGYTAINPIVILTEILAKCGFTKDEYNTHDDPIYEIKEKFFAIVYKDGEWVMFTGDYGSYESEESAPFEYLHQLQNLYRFWVGTELTVNL